MNDLARIRALAGLKEASSAQVITPGNDFYPPGFIPPMTPSGSNTVQVPIGWDNLGGGGKEAGGTDSGGAPAGAQGSTGSGQPSSAADSPSILDKIKNYAKSKTQPNPTDSEPVRDIKKYVKDIVDPPPPPPPPPPPSETVPFEFFIWNMGPDGKPVKKQASDAQPPTTSDELERIAKLAGVTPQDFPKGQAAERGPTVITDPMGYEPSTGDVNLPPASDPTKPYITGEPEKNYAVKPDESPPEVKPDPKSPVKKQRIVQLPNMGMPTLPEPVKPEPVKPEKPEPVKPKLDLKPAELPQVATVRPVKPEPVPTVVNPPAPPPPPSITTGSSTAPGTAPPAGIGAGPGTAPSAGIGAGNQAGELTGSGGGKPGGQGPRDGRNQDQGGTGGGTGGGQGPSVGTGAGTGNQPGGKWANHHWFSVEGPDGRGKPLPAWEVPDDWLYIGNGRYVSKKEKSQYGGTNPEVRYPNKEFQRAERPGWADLPPGMTPQDLLKQQQQRRESAEALNEIRRLAGIKEQVPQSGVTQAFGSVIYPAKEPVAQDDQKTSSVQAGNIIQPQSQKQQDWGLPGQGGPGAENNPIVVTPKKKSDPIEPAIQSTQSTTDSPEYIKRYKSGNRQPPLIFQEPSYGGPIAGPGLRGPVYRGPNPYGAFGQGRR